MILKIIMYYFYEETKGIIITQFYKQKYIPCGITYCYISFPLSKMHLSRVKKKSLNKPPDSNIFLFSNIFISSVAI